MKAVTWYGKHDVRVEEVPEPEVTEPTDAIVRVTLAAICGSDLHLYHDEIPGMLPGTVLGHEFVGVVESVGPAVRAFKKGDRVVGTFHIACGHCRACRRGDYHQCERGGVLGYGLAFGNLPGAQAELVRIPYADVNLRPIPAGLSDEQAIFAGDILTTAFGAVKNAGLRPGERCAVIGCGPVGIFAIQSAQVFGAAKTLAIDLIEKRLALAERLGAIPIDAGKSNPVSRVMAETGGEGADVVIEAVGGSQTLELAFDLVRGEGRISAVGVSAEETFAFPLMSSFTKAIHFHLGVANIHRDIDATLALVAAGRIDPTVIISHRLPLEEAPKGYRLFAERKATKVVLIAG